MLASLRHSIRQSVSHASRTLRMVWSASRGLTAAMAVFTLVGALLPLGVAWAGKRIVDAVVAGSRPLTLRWVVVELVVVASLALSQRALGYASSMLGLRLGVDVNVAILTKAIGLDLRAFEDSEFYDKLTRARREASVRPVSLIRESFSLAQSLITLAGYAVFLVAFSGWAVVVLLVATIPATLVEMRYAKAVFALRNRRSPETRRLTYLEYVLANDEHAKEVKLFGLGPTLLGRYRGLAEELYREDRRLARRRMLAQTLTLLGTGAFYAAYAAMALLAVARKITLGDMTLYVVAFRQGQQSFQSVLGSIGGIYEHNLYMSNLFDFLSLELPTPPRLPASTSTSALERVAGGPAIVFEDVGFKYPEQDRWALRHVDLSIGKGESIALVGENGAGKTTMVKLLTRLYTPTEGRILLDGRDLASWDETALRARFGVIFQDFNQYQMKLRENVGVGSIEHEKETPRIERAVERGGATELAKTIKGGLDAPLGRWFREGTELSGGQWQKIALARAFMREEADVLILDEPTAALDAEAEQHVFERFRALAEGRTTFVISHRFPTVRMADRIVVLKGGTILEMGTHDALVAANGEYARMFELQARGYR